MREVLLLKVGTAFDRLRQRRGDYDLWFAEALGAAKLRVVHVSEGEALPDPLDPTPVVISGSPAMVTHREAWSVASEAYLRARVERDAGPTLGVCYGHQLLGEALGGKVADNPRGRQIGTVPTELTTDGRADPLFAGLPATLTVQVSHFQAVVAPPAGARLLARAPRDAHHVLRFGPRTWGVQFHPEFDADIARTYVEERREALVAEGLDPETLLGAVTDSDHGARILRRFVELSLADGG